MRVGTALADYAGPEFELSIEDCASQIGSGALPEEKLPSAAVVLRPRLVSRRSGSLLKQTLARFRSLPTPVIGRINDQAILFDCRCLSISDEGLLLGQLRDAQPQRIVGGQQDRPA